MYVKNKRVLSSKSHTKRKESTTHNLYYFTTNKTSLLIRCRGSNTMDFDDPIFICSL